MSSLVPFPILVKCLLMSWHLYRIVKREDVVDKPTAAPVTGCRELPFTKAMMTEPLKSEVQGLDLSVNMVISESQHASTTSPISGFGLAVRPVFLAMLLRHAHRIFI